MKPISYDGITFSSLNVSAGFNPIYSGPYRSAQTSQRFGGNPVHGGVSQDIELRTVTFHPKPTYDTEETLLELIGQLNVLNGQERPFTALLNDGVTTVTRNMAVATYRQIGTNQIEIDFTASKAEWTATAATTVSQSGAVSPFSAAVANAGQAVVHPIYRISWSVQRSTFGAVVGQRYRKRYTLTNNQDRVMPPFAWRDDLGDTATLVSGSKAQSDGDDVRVIINGEDTTRELVGFNRTQSFEWFVVPGLDSGETIYLDTIYGNASATNPPEWSDPDPDKPVFDIGWEVGTATGGSTTTLVKAAAGWELDRWNGAEVHFLTGSNAGTSVPLNRYGANDATTLTWFTVLPSPIVNGDTFLVHMSSNNEWIYGVRQTERGADYARGRWYVSSASFTPNVVSFEAPGSWRPELIIDNRDSMGQKRFSMLTMGGSDKDPFALLDAQRMWEGNDQNVYNAGTADGVVLTTHLPINYYAWSYQFDNPNGMCKAWTGVRGSGAEDWAEVVAEDSATSGFQDFALALVDVDTDFGEVYQIAQAILPVNDIEIDLTWRRDTGSITSATTTVSSDTSKEWETDQFDNGSILMLSGVNSGIKRGITAGTGTSQTHSAFPTASADGDRYMVQNKRLKGQLRDGDFLSVGFITNDLSGSAGTETEVYELSCTLWVGDGPSGDPAGQHRALIGYAAGSKRLFLTADEQLVIDSDLRKIRIYDTVTEEYTATLTDPAVIIEWHNGTEWVRSADWLPLGLGDQLVWLEEYDMGTLELEVEYRASYLGV